MFRGPTAVPVDCPKVVESMLWLAPPVPPTTVFRVLKAAGLSEIGVTGALQ